MTQTTNDTGGLLNRKVRRVLEPSDSTLPKPNNDPVLKWKPYIPGTTLSSARCMSTPSSSEESESESTVPVTTAKTIGADADASEDEPPIKAKPLKPSKRGLGEAEQTTTVAYAPRPMQREYLLEKISSPFHIPVRAGLMAYYEHLQEHLHQVPFPLYLAFHPYLSKPRMKRLFEEAGRGKKSAQQVIKKLTSLKQKGIDPKLQVIYLPRGSRERYHIYINSNGDLLDCGGHYFDSKELHSNFSEGPFGCCAFTFRDGLFVYSHRINKFHHSSFLDGAPTDFAGELKAVNGCITVITNKSGHYKPGPKESLCMLMYLQAYDVVLDKVEFRAVGPELNPNHDADENSFESYNAADLLARLLPKYPGVKAYADKELSRLAASCAARVPYKTTRRPSFAAPESDSDSMSDSEKVYSKALKAPPVPPKKKSFRTSDMSDLPMNFFNRRFTLGSGVHRRPPLPPKKRMSLSLSDMSGLSMKTSSYPALPTKPGDLLLHDTIEPNNKEGSRTQT